MPASHRRMRWALVAVAALVTVALVAAVGVAWMRRQSAAGGDGASQAGTAAAITAAGLERSQSVPDPVQTHPGNALDCPDTDCVSVLFNGDLLFHQRLWQHFAGANTSATDGTAFDFDPLFEPMKRYMAATDLSVCNFETPVAPRGGPYADYPVFNIPPEVVDAAQHVGYTACTTATNHSWDRGAEGIARLTGMLDAAGIAHTGSYTTEEASEKPMVLDSPTGGGSVAVVAGTSALNGYKADPDWMVDQLRGTGDSHHQSDIDRAVAKARAAREQGADIVVATTHSVTEYIDYADPWQVSEMHALADTGAFDFIYGTGSHSAQPIEYYNGTWIVYGLGNAVTVTSSIPGHESNNQGVTIRVQFAGRKGSASSWRVNRIDWLPTASVRQGQYRWCPLAQDRPDGACWGDAQDAQVRQRIHDVLYRNDPDPNVVREWLITEETSR